MSSETILSTIILGRLRLKICQQSPQKLCEEIRQKIIQTTSKNGGHLGPNLGVVELTVALHSAFDSPTDAFAGMSLIRFMCTNF